MSDTAYPNILVVNPDGTISAALSGSLQMPLQVPPLLLPVLSPAHAVRWVDGAADAAQIGAAQPAADTNELIANAISPDGQTLAQISATAKDADAGNITASIYDKPSATVLASAQIIDRSGSSNFVQYAVGPDNRKLNYGFAFAHFAASTSAIANVPHFLGHTPHALVATPLFSGGLLFNIEYAVTAWDASNFNLTCTTYPGIAAVTGDFYFSWIAIG